MSEYTQPNPAELPQTRGERLADAIAATEGIATFNMQYGISPNGRQIAKGGASLADLHAIESSKYGGPNHDGQVDQSLVAVVQTGNGETLGVVRAQAEVEGSPTEGYVLVRMPTEPSQLSSTNRVQNPNAIPQVIARLSPEVPVRITADGVGAKGNPSTNIVINNGELFVADLDPRPGLNARVLTRPRAGREADVSFRNASAVWRPNQEAVLGLLTQIEPTDSSEGINVTLQRQVIPQASDMLTPEAISVDGGSDTRDGHSVIVEGLQTPAEAEDVWGSMAYEAPTDIVDAAAKIREPFLTRLKERVDKEGLVVTDEVLDAIEAEVQEILGIRNAALGNIMMGKTVEMVTEESGTNGAEQGRPSISEALGKPADSSGTPLATEESIQVNDGQGIEQPNHVVKPRTIESDSEQMEEQKRLRNNEVIARAIAQVPQGSLIRTVQNVLGAVIKAKLDNYERINGEYYPQLLAVVTQTVRSARGESLDIEAKTAERIFRRVQELSGGRPIPNEVWGATSNSSQLGRMRLNADTILRDTVLEIVKRQLTK